VACIVGSGLLCAVGPWLFALSQLDSSFLEMSSVKYEVVQSEDPLVFEHYTRDRNFVDFAAEMLVHRAWRGHICVLPLVDCTIRCTWKAGRGYL
jgi:hypothetical protein